MPKVTGESLKAFSDQFQNAVQRVGGGKVGLDSKLVRAAVRANREAAYRYVELHCRMAASQPGYLQPALIVAGAYQIEFEDDALIKMVKERADALDAHAHLERIGFVPDMKAATAEPAEREAARAWWRSSDKKEGICDACRTPLRRGDGYLIDGRLIKIGKGKVNLGIEILCQTCFVEFRNDPRDPGGERDDYVRIG
jgi:hypothetical protein